MARLIVSIALAFFAAACSGGGGASLRPTASTTASAAPTPSAPGVPAPTAANVTVIPQPLLDQMLAQVSDLSSVPASELTVETAEQVTWPDGSLGCPEPGMMYTQTLVDGYRVVIRAGDMTYDFRGSGDTFRLCQNGGGQPKASIEIPPPINVPPDR